MKSTNEEKQKLVDNEQGKDENEQGKVENKEIAKENEVPAPSSGFTLKDFGAFIVAFVFEFFGTFLFLTAVLLGSGPEATLISFWIIITMIAPFSGGHVNPAVTFGFYIYDMKYLIGIPKLIMYFLAQFAGAYVSLKFCQGIREKQEIAIFKQELSSKEFMSEFFYTGTFIFVILYCCSKKTQVSTNRALNCVMIASWLYYAATSAGKRSVGALNPAILLTFVEYNDSIDSEFYSAHKKDILYMFYAHFGGALLFALFFFIVELLFPTPAANEEKTDLKDKEKKEDAKIDVKS